MTVAELSVCQSEFDKIRTSDQALLFLHRWAGPLLKDAAQAHLLRGENGIPDRDYCRHCGADGIDYEEFDGECPECGKTQL